MPDWHLPGSTTSCCGAVDERQLEPDGWRYAFLVLSLALVAVWLILCAARPDLRPSMLRVSLGTMLLGLTEPVFVPRYWNPPTLWNLARQTGFDMESLLFSFGVGGIVFAAYDALVGQAPSGSIADEQTRPRHRIHLLAVLSAPVVFVALLSFTGINPIYCAAIAMTTGFVATLYCRPDLWPKMAVSGILFLLLYFVVFVLFARVFPGYVTAVWNLKALSGVLVWGVPLEELMFAVSFGLYWSSVYEHLTWRRGGPRLAMQTALR
jgi:lycopene cyclase-like protein